MQAMTVAAESAGRPLWQVLTTFAYFGTLAAAIGFVLVYVFAVRPVLRVQDAGREVLLRRSAVLLGGAGVAILVNCYFQVASRTARAAEGVSYGQALAPARMWAYLSTPAKAGQWISAGGVTLLHVGFVVLAAILLIPLLGRREPGRLAVLAAPVVVLVSVVRSVPNALGSLSLDTVTERVLVQVHIVGGTLWVGGLALLVLLAGARARLGRDAGATWALIWQRFSTVALCAVGAILVSGLWLTYKEFGSIGQLFSTEFGRFLLLKLLFVLGMISAGAANQLWMLPKITRYRANGDAESVWMLAVRRFPRLVAAEVLLGVGVLLVVPFLDGSPREQAGDTGPEKVATPGILLLGAVIALMLALSFVATAKASDALARRPAPAI